MITEYDKLIYNTFLKTSRQSSKLPFKYRKDFSKLDESTFIHIKKLASFFKKFPNIKLDEFFSAPYKIYSDESYFPLEFYISLKATKAYTLVQKQVAMADPDCEEQIKFIKTSLVFIYNFCKSKNTSFNNYIIHKTNNEFSFIIHLKERNISIYSLFGFDNFEKAFKSREAEVLKFILGDRHFLLIFGNMIL